MKIKKLSIKDIQDICDSYRYGSTCEEIGKKYNLSRGTVLNILHDNNVEVRKCGRRRKLSNSSTICKLYKQGYSSTQLGKLFNLARSTIRTILRENNIQMRPKGRYETPYDREMVGIF